MPLLPRHRAEAAAFRARRRGHPTVHELRVAEVTRLTEDAVMVALDVPDELREAYRFAHGQHVAVIHDTPAGQVRRSYSICSPAGGDLRIAVRRVPGGAVSGHLTEQLAEGETLRVLTPTGSFTTDIRPEVARRYVAIAGGSGITPVLSIVATILEREPKSEITLVYANRTRRSTMFLGELDALAARHPGRLAVHHFWSRERTDGEPSVRRLDRAVLDAIVARELAAGDVASWVLCGPAALMHEAAEALGGRGVPPERVKRELFTAAGEPVAADDQDRPLLTSEVAIRFDGADTTLTLSSRGPAILSAALALFPELPYSCSDGVCGTCRAKVTAGAVAMDRCSALDAGERREGWILACQAHPVTPRVGVDFDAA